MHLSGLFRTLCKRQKRSDIPRAMVLTSFGASRVDEIRLKIALDASALTDSSGPGAQGVPHAEDLALALMTEENRFDGQVAYMAAYGRCSAVDGQPGVRRPCTVSSNF
jgi:hypothetical protein